MKRSVVDSSFILATFYDENKEVRDACINLLEEVRNEKMEVYTIALFYLETSNALRFKIQDEKDLQIKIRKIYALPFHVFSLDKKHLESITLLALSQNTTVYDTAFHYTATLLNGFFYTTDRKYYNNATAKENIICM
jgi:predicted nucleic acid-binding protein